MSASEIPDGYYALHDADAPGQLAYWRASGGRIRAWKTSLRAMSDQEARDAIAEDPDACRQRFSRRSGRCWMCGHRITDPESAADGLGPDCRQLLAGEAR